MESKARPNPTRGSRRPTGRPGRLSAATESQPKSKSGAQRKPSEKNSSPQTDSVKEAEIIRRERNHRSRRRKDYLACEEPLEIRVRGRSVAVTMRTPGNDDELAAGFLFTEAIIHRRTDLTEIVPCRRGQAAHFENTLNVFLARSVEVNFDQLTRHVFASSSCGLCGKAAVENIHQHFAPILSSFAIAAESLLRAPDRLRAAQQTFAQTGGLHAAAILDGNGSLVVSREDIGRHNAVDKVIGHGLLTESLPFDRHVLMVSGRASFEIMQKALAAQIPVVAAVSAPSSLAVEFARESGQTLIGFLRGNAFNIYSHPERVS
ncbi:MAG: formate dehydrogenase accessory sulfurtransferase FdhD [Verrucomicrobia bacterium]|nr:formate dehydrogenase accessory sulfurtransferase FdhD [Verrucomicrobiota bacterium]